MKTFKREEIYANVYLDLCLLGAEIAEFIDNCCGRARLHVALGSKPLDELEQTATLAATSQGATLSVFQGWEDQSDARSQSVPIKLCLNGGVHPNVVCQLCAICAGLIKSPPISANETLSASLISSILCMTRATSAKLEKTR